MHTLELLFRKCRAQLRVLKIMLESGEWMSLYEIQKKAGITVSEDLIELMVDLGLVEKEEVFKRYRINRENKLIKSIEKFFEEVGY